MPEAPTRDAPDTKPCRTSGWLCTSTWFASRPSSSLSRTRFMMKGKIKTCPFVHLRPSANSFGHVGVVEVSKLIFKSYFNCAAVFRRSVTSSSSGVFLWTRFNWNFTRQWYFDCGNYTNSNFRLHQTRPLISAASLVPATVTGGSSAISVAVSDEFAGKGAAGW